MNYEIKETEIRLPSYWGSYLVNGDSSGLENYEESLIHSTLEWADISLSNHQCVDMKDDESFEYSYIPGLLAGNYSTYIFINRPVVTSNHAKN